MFQRIIWSVVFVLMLVGCVSVHPVATGTKSIVLASSETRPARLSKAVLPAGEYVPDFQSDTGIYYLAPKSVVTSGLGLSTASRGGLFVPFPTAEDQRQAVWIQAAMNTTALGAILAAANSTGSTYLYRFDVPVSYSVK